MRTKIIQSIEEELVLSPEGGWVEKGGPGSGHHGHKGRKGKKGGSAPSKAGKMAVEDSVRSANSAFLQLFKERGNPYYTKVKDINSGYCQEWAYVTAVRTGSEVWKAPGWEHYFVKEGDEFYGAQTPKGVRDWIYLKGFKEYRSGEQNARKYGEGTKIEQVLLKDFESGRVKHFKQSAADRVLEIIEE